MTTDPHKPFRELIEVIDEFCATWYYDKHERNKARLDASLIAAKAALPALYPCCECGVLRTKDQGGDTFTVCDSCWDKLHLRAKPALAEVQRVDDTWKCKHCGCDEDYFDRDLEHPCYRCRKCGKETESP